MQKTLLIGAVLLTTCAVSGAESLCQPREEIVFSCSTSRTKVISVCSALRPAGAARPYIAYRFGTGQNVELDITVKEPGKRSSPALFHYFRPGVDRTSLSFKRQSTTYTVFSEVDEALMPTHKAGVTASVLGRRPVNVPCIGNPTENWFKLDGQVACEDEDWNSCQEP